MSKHVTADGYVVLPDGTIANAHIDETVFDYPTGVFDVQPRIGHTDTMYEAKISPVVDPMTTTSKVVLLVDGNPQNVPSSQVVTLQLGTGTHVVSALVTDSNGAFWDAPDYAVVVSELPPPPPPPPPTHLGCIGVSGGTIGEAKAIATFKPPIMRSFSPSDAAAVHAAEGGKHISVVYSNDGGHGRGYDLIGVTKITDAPAQAWLKEMQTAFKNKDVPHFIIWGHEEDIHGSDAVKLSKVYDGGRVVVDFMKSQGWNVRTVVCTTGMPYDDASANGYQKWNFKNADVIGADNYARGHWQTLIDFGKRIGKPVCAPETGIKAQTDPNLYKDAVQAASMTADKKYYDQCLFVTYWIGGGNDLQNKPTSTKLLANMIAAGPQEVAA